MKSGSPYAFQSGPESGAAGSGSLILIQSHTASNVASVAFTTGIDNTYLNYVFVLTNIIPQTDTATLYLTLSVDAGSNWLNSNYRWTRFNSSDGSVMNIAGSASDSEIEINGLGNQTGENANYWLTLSNPASSTAYKPITGQSSLYSSAPSYVVGMVGGVYFGAATAINGVKFAMSSGNITSGVFKMYGVAG